MAIVVRRYSFVGPSNTDLTRYVGSSAAQNTLTPVPVVVDLQIDDAVAGAATTLDEYMAMIGWIYDPAATDPPLKIQDEGVSTGVRRAILNFSGAAVNAVDNPADGRVDVEINAAALTEDPPTQIDVGDAGATGASTFAARADHEHALPAPGVPVNVTKAGALSGSSTKVAREDHKHDIDTAAPSSTGTANVEGVSQSLARADHIHKTLVEVDEEGVLAGSRPKINFIGAAVTAVDNPGLDRVDVTVTAAALTASAPTQIDIGDAAIVGVATDAARADHQHALPTPAAPADVTKAAASAGASTIPARADHKHDVTTAAPGAIGVATASGEGSATTLARSDHTHQSNTAPVNVTKAAAIVGTSGEPARADHKHDVTTAVAVSTGSANAEGVSTSLSRADHVHVGTVDVQDEGIAVSREPIIDFVGGGVVATAGAGKVTVTIPGGGPASVSIQQATATASTTVTATSDTLINAMSLTAAASGSYMVEFTASATLPNSSYSLLYSIYVNGVQVAASVRTHSLVNTGTMAVHAYLTGVTAGQAIEIRARNDSASKTSTVLARTLTIMQVA